MLPVRQDEAAHTPTRAGADVFFVAMVKGVIIRDMFVHDTGRNGPLLRILSRQNGVGSGRPVLRYYTSPTLDGCCDGFRSAAPVLN